MAFVPLQARDDDADEAVQILRDFGIEYDALDHAPCAVAEQIVLFALDELHRAFTKGPLSRDDNDAHVPHHRLRAECGLRYSGEDSRLLRRARRVLGMGDFSAYEWQGLGEAYKGLTYCIISILCATGRDVELSCRTFLGEPHTTMRTLRILRFFPFIETVKERAVRAAVSDALHRATITFLLQNEWLVAARSARIVRVLLADTEVRRIYKLNPRHSAAENLRRVLSLLLEWDDDEDEGTLLPRAKGMEGDATLLDRMMWAVNVLAMDPRGNAREVVRNVFEQPLVEKLKMA